MWHNRTTGLPPLLFLKFSKTALKSKAFSLTHFFGLLCCSNVFYKFSLTSSSLLASNSLSVPITSASMSPYYLPTKPFLVLPFRHLPSWRIHLFSCFSQSTYPISYSLKSTPWMSLCHITALFKFLSASLVSKSEFLWGRKTFISPWSVHGPLHPINKCEVMLLLMVFSQH